MCVQTYKPGIRKGQANPFGARVCPRCELARAVISSENGRANCLGAPPILACQVSGNDRLTEASRQGSLRSQAVCPTLAPRFSFFVGRRSATWKLLRKISGPMRMGF